MASPETARRQHALRRRPTSLRDERLTDRSPRRGGPPGARDRARPGLGAGPSRGRARSGRGTELRRGARPAGRRRADRLHPWIQGVALAPHPDRSTRPDPAARDGAPRRGGDGRDRGAADARRGADRRLGGRHRVGRRGRGAGDPVPLSPGARAPDASSPATSRPMPSSSRPRTWSSTASAGLVTLACADLLGPAGDSLPVPDVVIANLPYVASAEVDARQGSLGYEPRVALDGGPDGLTLLRRLLDELPGAGSAAARRPSWRSASARSMRSRRCRLRAGRSRSVPDLAGLDRVVRLGMPD